MYFSFAVIVFIKLIALKYVLAEAPPRKMASEGHRQITFAHENETVILKCPFESSSEFQTFVDWTRGNSSLYMTQGYEITLKGFLKIKSVSKQHSGIYTCEAVNGYGTVRVNLTLVVDNPENEIKNYTISNSASRIRSCPPTITQRPSSFSVDVGGEATFHCIASGQPLPHIFWLKDGYLIQHSSSYISKRKTHSSIRLKGLKKSDSGDYKCIARNKLGEDEMDHSLQVTEPSPPPSIIALEPPDVTIREGSSATFVCDVSSRPGVQLHIKWLKKQEDGEEIDSSDVNLFRSGSTYYRPLNFTDGEFITYGGVYKSKYIIRNARETDSGTYICLGLNHKGFNYRDSTLKVIGRSNPLANTARFATSRTSLAVTIIVAVIVILAAVACVSHRYRRNKSGDKTGKQKVSVPNVELGNFRYSATPIRKPNKGDLNNFPETADPKSTSRLLNIGSSFVYEHSESQMSKSIQERTTFH